MLLDIVYSIVLFLKKSSIFSQKSKKLDPQKRVQFFLTFDSDHTKLHMRAMAISV